MAIYAGKNARLYIGGYDIGALAAGINSVREKEYKQYSVLDGSDGYHYMPIIGKDTISIDGIFDDNYTTVLNSLRTSSTGYQVIIPFGVTQGDRTWACNSARLGKYNVTSVVTDINKVTFDLVVDTIPFDECKSLHPAATRTTSSNGSSINESAGSSSGSVGYLQIWSLGANDTLAVKIQHSTNDTNWSDLITFTTLDGASATYTSERKTTSSTVNQYIRAAWTFGGVSPYTGTFIVAWKRV